MASTRDYLEFVLDLFRKTEGVTYKKMMGEFLLYQDGVLFGGVYDNRLLIKKTPSLEKYGFREQIPYPSAKPMLLLDCENPDEIRDLMELAITDLKQGLK